MPRSVLLGICFASGAMLGILGTALHGSIWMLGSDPTSAAMLPWGAALALLIQLLALLWAGTTGRSLVEPMLLGSTTFTVATIAYLWPGPDQLVVPFASQTWEALPGSVLASLIWWLGTAVITLIGMLVVKWVLVADVAEEATEQPLRQVDWEAL
ncbi:hypothetical protein HGQ17_11785 [Nesterenkonia sp. MY13]|uniref:Uncharacterized protein n=1 Tax=Nesterenkonia sedimenti TaxID=1463632 RepID=A0A7X8YEB7_9MICC|nr:hypothetical protein [Nesterenkonia sedimenti]NLS10658.1 hypothetical protein [Nesterenkonia sedimenti]